MPPALAIGIGAGIGGVGSVIGAGMQSSAASDAADKQASAANQSNQLQKQIFEQQEADQAPWRQAGISALYGPGGLFVRKDGGQGLVSDPTQLAAAKDKFIQDKMNEAKQQRQNVWDGLSGLQKNAIGQDKFFAQNSDDVYRQQAEQAWNDSPQSKQTYSDFSQYQVDPSLTKSFTADDFQKDPGYDFRMQEGQKALERSAAAKGGLMGGGFGKALSRYGQDYASNEYQNAYNRFTNDQTNRFNRLSSLSGLGQTANAQLGQAGQNYANQAGQNMMGAANAQGAAGIASANAWGGAASNLGNLGMQYGYLSALGNKPGQNWMQQSTTALAGEPTNNYSFVG